MDALIQALIDGEYNNGARLEAYWGNKPLVTDQAPNTMLSVGTDNTKLAVASFDGYLSGVAHRIPATDGITLSGTTLPASAIRIVRTTTGNGTVTSMSTTAPGQQWTLTCTAAATNSGTFSVVGSVAGALANATVGTPYSAGGIAFTINDGTADFQVGDTIVLVTNDWIWGIWLLTVDVSGTFTVTSGASNGTGYGTSLAAVTDLPDIPAGGMYVGYLLVNVSGSGPFIPGTTPLVGVANVRGLYVVSDTLIGSTLITTPSVGGPSNSLNINVSADWSVLLMIDLPSTMPRWFRLFDALDSAASRVHCRVGATGSGADLEVASLAWSRGHRMLMAPLTATVEDN